MVVAVGDVALGRLVLCLGGVGGKELLDEGLGGRECLLYVDHELG